MNNILRFMRTASMHSSRIAIASIAVVGVAACNNDNTMTTTTNDRMPNHKAGNTFFMKN